MNHIRMNLLRFLGLLVITGSLHAQQPGVDCAPIQGQGWQGCAPIDQSQQLQAHRPPLQQWRDQWGAIASDPKTGALGTVIGLTTEVSAETAAVSDCLSKGGRLCKIELSYRNQCAAMIVGEIVYNTNPGETQIEAINKGMQMCRSGGFKNCHVYYAACSLPTRIQ